MTALAINLGIVLCLTLVIGNIRRIIYPWVSASGICMQLENEIDITHCTQFGPLRKVFENYQKVQGNERQ